MRAPKRKKIIIDDNFSNLQEKYCLTSSKENKAIKKRHPKIP
jgi:hypothetical protein